MTILIIFLSLTFIGVITLVRSLYKDSSPFKKQRNNETPAAHSDNYKSKTARSTRRRPAPSNTPRVINFSVKGTSFRNKSDIAAARYLEHGDTLILQKEPDNPVDPNAVKVLTINGAHIGYVPVQFSADISDKIDFINSCKVSKISSHDIPFIDAELRFSTYRVKQPEFIKEEFQVSPEDNMIKLSKGMDVESSLYASMSTVIMGTYDLPKASIDRAKSLKQGEKLCIKKAVPTKYFPHKLDLYTLDNIELGFIIDEYLRSNFYNNIDKIVEVRVDATMESLDFERIGIRIIYSKDISRELKPFSTSIESGYFGPYPQLYEADSIKRSNTERALELALSVANYENGIDARFICCQCYRLLKDYQSEEQMIIQIIEFIQKSDIRYMSPSTFHLLKRRMPEILKRLSTVQTRLASQAKKNRN